MMSRTLLDAFPALLTVQARVREPLDADAVAELDWRVLGMLADGYDDTDALRDRSAPPQHPRTARHTS